MTPEARAHLDTACLSLIKAQAGLRASAVEPSLAENAARDAYYVAFHAAHALIVERTGREPKTHAGVHRQFHRLTVDEPGMAQPLRDFLIRAYDFKAVADYATVPPPRISVERASRAVETAEKFLAAVNELLEP